MTTCGDCGQEMEPGEIHNHFPDIYLDVYDSKFRLMRSRIFGYKTRKEELPFNIPDRWANWILDTCGGTLAQSGMYRLPGMIWEWVLHKLKNDPVDSGAFIADRINSYLDELEKTSE